MNGSNAVAGFVSNSASRRPGLAGLPYGYVCPFVTRVTETGLPLPSLEIIGKFSHFATQADIEELIIIGEPFVSRTGVVDAAELNPGSNSGFPLR